MKLTHVLIIASLYCCKFVEGQPATILIFDNLPPFIRITYPVPQLEYGDDRFQLTIFDNFIKNGFNPRHSVVDTITYHPKNEYLVLSLLYLKTREPLDYLVRSGDTIIFRYIDGLPVAANTNGDQLNYERDRLILNGKKDTFTPYEIYKTPIILLKTFDDLQDVFLKAKDYYIPSRSYLENELLAINNDTQFQLKYPLFFSFLRSKLKYQIANLDFDQKRISAESLSAILDLNKSVVETVPYSYFYPLLEAISDSVNVKTANFLKHDNGSETDYRDVFDRTIKWVGVNDFYKKLLLFKYLQKIGEVFSTADLNRYLNRFEEFSNDTLLANRIRNEFLLSKQITSEDSLFVIDLANNELSLNSLITQNIGKVVYVDFWASWCAPCRAEMKYAAQLRNDFEGKDIVFVYLSVDKSRNAWENAATAEGLITTKHNFIAKNVENSSFLKDIGFGTIPRYLLFDKNGVLVHKNAPPPGSEEIRRLLKMYDTK